MTVFIFWVLFSVAVGVYASNRGRSGLGWFALSLLISPLLGLIFCAVSTDKSRAPGAGQPGAATHVKCPACAEWVLPEARVCKHCGAALVPPTHTPQQRAAEAEATERTNYIMGVVFVVALFAVAGMLSRFVG